MIKTSEELNLKINKARLLTRDELSEYEDWMPYISMGCCWWLADEDDYGDIAYAEGNYTDDDMYCSKDEANTWLRVALEIEGDIDAGDEFVFCGCVFTALSEELAISNNFLGCARYSESLEFDDGDEDEWTIDTIISTIIPLEDATESDDCDTYENDEDEDCSVVVFDTIDDETRALLGVLDLDD
jgi:hypothetical protein